MSRVTAEEVGAAAGLDALRRRIAQLERGTAIRVSPVGVLPPGLLSSGVSLGDARIDSRFEGGALPFGTHEVAARSAGEAAPALGFALMVMARVLALRPHGMGLIVQSHGPAGENGALYGPGLEALGLETRRLALVRVRNAEEVLKVADDALRSGAAAAVAAEIWDADRVDLSLTRRFNLSAQAHEAMMFLILREQAGTSAALTRWAVGSGTSGAEQALAARRGLKRPFLGRPSLDLALTRNRRGGAQGWPLGEWRVEWNVEQRCFHPPGADGFERAAAAPHSAPVAGASGHGPDAAGGDPQGRAPVRPRRLGGQAG